MCSPRRVPRRTYAVAADKFTAVKGGFSAGDFINTLTKDKVVDRADIALHILNKLQASGTVSAITKGQRLYQWIEFDPARIQVRLDRVQPL